MRYKDDPGELCQVLAYVCQMRIIILEFSRNYADAASGLLI
jgi:hypothetical protein